MSRIYALENLDTLGVSLVKKGANRKRLVAKEEGAMDADTIEVLKTILEDVKAENESNSDEILKSVDAKAQGAVSGIARLMSAFKDVLTAEHFAKAAELAGMGEVVKNLPGVDQPCAADGTVVKKKGKVTVAAPAAAENAPDAGYGAHMKSFDQLPEDVRAELKKLWKENEETKKKADEAEERSKKLESESMTKSFIRKAEKEYAHVPGQSAEGLGSLLKALHDQNPETAAKVEELLKSAEAVIGKSELFKEYGSSHVGAGGSAAQLEELAKSYIAKGDTKLSYAEAYSKALAENPALYAQYLKENPNQLL